MSRLNNASYSVLMWFNKLPRFAQITLIVVLGVVVISLLNWAEQSGAFKGARTPR